MSSAERAVAELFRSDAEGIDFAPVFAELPDSAVTAGLSLFWDQTALFELADQLPANEIPVASVKWTLDVRWAPELQTLGEVVSGPADSAEYERILRCDLNYPIVQAAKGERWVVLDGYHRVAKAVLQGRDRISTVRLPPFRIPEILRRDSPFFEALNTLGLQNPDGLAAFRRLAREAVSESGRIVADG